MKFQRPRMRAVVFGTGLVAATALPGTAPVAAATNLAPNPRLETLVKGFPKCWTAWGSGSAKGRAKVVKGRSGKRGVQVSLTGGKGQRALVQTPACAIKARAGQALDLSVYYKSTAPVRFMLFRQNAKGVWSHWTDSAGLAKSAKVKRAKFRTPAVPAGTVKVRFGLAVTARGSVTTDDYAAYAVKAPKRICTDAVGCKRGKWTVRSFGGNGVRAMHSVLLHNGKVLLIAGSGNDRGSFDAGRFTSRVYDPVKNTYTDVKTPYDMFCAGHVQLANGKVLVLSGSEKYGEYTAGGQEVVGFTGSKKSYLFNPATNSYEKLNDLNDGHWYPSATILGNGDVFAVGGSADDLVNGQSYISRVTERYSYAENRWLKADEIRQSGFHWAMYPSLMLMANGKLFYSGSFVFGLGPIADLGQAATADGTLTAGVYDDGGNRHAPTFTETRGLRDPVARDQSASVLLPPAQDQRVMVIGGASSTRGIPGHKHTDIVDLDSANPAYRPGPDLPQGKLYVSAVLLPDGTVFETGGSRNIRSNHVFEASIFNPAVPRAQERWTPMASDPVARSYHNTAVLLPDGRVLAEGSNPGDNSFDTRISIFSPPYLFKGPRPAISGVKKQWAYGSKQTFTSSQAVTRASLVRPIAVTHSSDPNQRSVALPVVARKGGKYTVKLNANPNLTPPGWYMLFTTNAAGVPSVAKWVHVG
ncbi:galactose oxidase early set domain-containing protein [Actinocorallia longicatena]|uniref:Galactose oxidase-like Early set domain-containing protein n=1 Tax=Actinocorallia longicatena TaxID=111803 RepID=A0ABP6QNC8_9ACTN